MKPTILNASILLCALTVGSTTALAAPTSNPVPGAAARLAHPSQALPAALRPVLYQALSKVGGSTYTVNPAGCATLPKQKLKACFDSDGARFMGADSPLVLHLAAYGRSGHLEIVQTVNPLIKGNQVRYRHGELTEWWRVLPVGFEQGFTLDKRPGGQGELTLKLAASIKAEQHKDALTWGSLRYGDLVVTDAKGRVVPATLKSKGNQIVIAVNDAHAVYPLTVDPLVWIEQKVTANDGAYADFFGTSVAVQGTTALVGADGAEVDGITDAGAVYVFTESNGVWSQTQKLSASDGAALDNFGYSVALDGTTALIGAEQATVGGKTWQGAVYVFTLSAGVWTQTQKLLASDGGVGDRFGSSVLLSGTVALVGATETGYNGSNVGPGAVYAFTESSGNWSETQKLTASDGAAGDSFGYSISLDGATALISAVYATVNGNSDQGAAYIFTNSDGTWSQAQKLTANDGAASTYFGVATAISNSAILVSAPYAAVLGKAGQGVVYAFSQLRGTWTQTQELIASDGVASDTFGYSIALDGATALISAFGATVHGNSYQGAAYVFANSGGTWTQVQKLIASDGTTYEFFGKSVALDGATALIGEFYATVNGNLYQGAAYFYDQDDLDLAVNAPQTVGVGETYINQAIATNNASASSPAVIATMTVPAAASFISATATQGSCNEASGVVTCDFGQINGNAGTAMAEITLKANSNIGTVIDNTATLFKTTPPLTASALSTIGCPTSYVQYDGTLGPGLRAVSPIYRTSAGRENAILAAPAGFQLFAVTQFPSRGRKIYYIPGNETHRWTPAGTFMWMVKAGDSSGNFTLCVLHP